MYIVLIDMRESNKNVVLLNDDEKIVLFDTYEDAEDVISKHPLSAFPIMIIDLDGES